MNNNTTMLVIAARHHNFDELKVFWASCAPPASWCSRRIRPRRPFHLIEMEGVTTSALVPPLAQAWVASAEKLKCPALPCRPCRVGGSSCGSGRLQARSGSAAVQQVFGRLRAW